MARPDSPRMLERRPEILFLSHDASRTGAPMVLLTFLRWLRANSDYQFGVLLGRGGALEPDFASIAPTATATAAVGRHLYRLPGGVSPVVLEMMQRQRLRWMARRLAGADLLYSNTLQNGELLAARCGSPDARSSRMCTNWSGG